MWRAWLWAVAAAAVWVLSALASQPTRVLPSSANAAEFSAIRATQRLAQLLGGEQPHPLGSVANAAVLARIRAQFAALGVPTRLYQRFACNTWRGLGYVPCGTVTDVVGEVLPGSGQAIGITAHYDSVPAGPGAADDGAGVAAVLEATRALRATAPATARHPVVALLTDGEEEGLLGVAALLQDDVALRGSIAVDINLEARGTRGASLLFQTSPGAGRLIDLYAQHAPEVAASSLFADVYRHLPNDTDLTMFLRDGIAGLNFAFIGNLRYYHSPLDQRSRLNLASLQMQGDSVLRVVRGLESSDLATLAGHPIIYLSVLNRWLPRLPFAWALPLALLAALVLAVVLAATPSQSQSVPRTFAALLLPPALVAAGLLAAWLVTLLVRVISASADPSYAHPLAMRWALGMSLWTLTLLLSRFAAAREASIAAWLWMAALAIAAAALWPAASPYFLFPCLLAAPAFAGAALLPRRWRPPGQRAAAGIAALGALIVLLGLAYDAESLLGLRVFALLVVPAALALGTVVPLLETARQPRPQWCTSVVVSGAAALTAAVLAAFTPAYSVASPQRVNLLYLQGSGGAKWIADTSWKLHRPERLPPQLRKALTFTLDPSVAPEFGLGADYVAATPPRLPLPNASVISDRRDGALRTVVLRLQGSPHTDVMNVFIPQTLALATLTWRTRQLNFPSTWAGATRLRCFGRDCADTLLTLTFRGNPTGLQIAEERYGLPEFGAVLQRARPNTAMPSQSGDETLLIKRVEVPAGG